VKETANLIRTSLDKRKIVYQVEHTDKAVTIWLDKKNNFGCEINSLDITVFHLDGSLTFNLDEGREYDICSTAAAVDHIFLIVSNTLFQEEVYKNDKLCSVRQYVILNGEKFFCSSLWIKHIFYFFAFLKKEVKITEYSYNSE